MTRIIRAFFGVGLVVAGVLIVGVSSALAASSSGTQTVTATVPTSISVTGVAATASGTTPPGAATGIDGGSMTIATNNATGYTLSVAAGGANFVSGGNTFPIADDSVNVCVTQMNNCGGGGALTTTGTTLKTTAAPSSDLVWIRHLITLGGSQAAGAYSVTITYTATTNP